MSWPPTDVCVELSSWLRWGNRVVLLRSYGHGLHHAAPGGSGHVRIVDDTITGETQKVYVVRVLLYAFSSLLMGTKVREGFEMTKHQGEYEVSDMIRIMRDPGEVEEH